MPIALRRVNRPEGSKRPEGGKPPERPSHSTNQSIQAMLLACLLLWGCESNKPPRQEKSKEAPKAEGKAPEMFYLPGENETTSVDLSRSDRPAANVGVDRNGTTQLHSTSRPCPSEMVLVGGDYCIDRFEVHLVDVVQARTISPYYPPSRRYTNLLTQQWTNMKTPKGILGSLIPLPKPPEFQLTEDFEPRAQSTVGVLPAGYLTRGLADSACKNAGKRLCTRSEWVKACRGEQNQGYPYGTSYEALACNVHRKSHPAQLLHRDSSRNHLDPRLNLTEDEDGPLLRRTGETPRCVSTWGDDGIYDMVGNLDEWVADVDGTFVGGFYSRATTMGCEASIESHDPGYLDYSLGTRCCRDLTP